MVQIQGVGSFSLGDFDAELRVAERILSETQENARQSQKLLQQSLLSAVELFQHEDRLGIQRQELGLQKQAVESRLALDAIDRKVKEFALKREQTRQGALEKLGPPPLSFPSEQQPGQQMGPPPPPEFGPPLPPEMQSRITQESQDQRFTEQIKGFQKSLESLTPAERIEVLPEVNTIAQSMLGLHTLQQLPEKQQLERRKEEMELEKTGAEIEYFKGGGSEGRQERRQEERRQRMKEEFQADPDLSDEQKRKAISFIEASEKLPDPVELKNQVLFSKTQKRTAEQAEKSQEKTVRTQLKDSVVAKIKAGPGELFGLASSDLQEVVGGEYHTVSTTLNNMPETIKGIERIIEETAKDEEVELTEDGKRKLVKEIITPYLISVSGKYDVDENGMFVVRNQEMAGKAFSSKAAKETRDLRAIQEKYGIRIIR